MTIRTQNLRLFMMLLADATLLVVALIGACWLRFEPALAGEHVRQMMGFAPVIVPAEVALFGLFGLYRGRWRWTGAADLFRLAQACFVAMLFAFACAFVFRLDLSRSLLIIDAILGFVMAGSLRVGIRTLCEARATAASREADRVLDRQTRSRPPCGPESKGVEHPPPELAASCIHPMH